MGLIKVNDNPSRRELRQFAAIWFPLMWIAFALLNYLSTAALAASTVLVLVGVVVGAVGYMKPAFMHPIYLLWMYAVYPVGWTISHMVLLVIFLGIFTPVALLMRLVGYDPMRRRRDRDDGSNWVQVVPPASKAEYFRQF